MDPKKQPENFKASFMLARAWSVGSGIVFLCLLGYFLDQHFHTDNLYILIGFLTGVLYTAYEIYKVVKSEK